MSRHLGSSPHSGEAARAPRKWTAATFAVLAVLMVVLGGSLMVLTTAPPRAAVTLAPSATPAVPETHGDLVVTSGETVTLLPTGGIPIYYQGGNITVEAGGTLVVKNLVVVFVQFVSNIGTPLQRLSHIYTFQDAGTTTFTNSTLTTDTNVLNAYVKLNVVVTGTMTLWNSHLLFPGWVTVSGTSADLTLNNTSVAGNPGVPFLVEPPVIQADTEYAPSLLATGGAQINAFDSTIEQTYADDTAISGIPRPVPLNATGIDVTAGGTNVTDLYTPNDSANLTQDWLYPAGITGGYVAVFFNDSSSMVTQSSVQIWYEGVAYPIGTLTFLNNTTNGFLSFPIPAGLTAAINAAGMLSYLNNTGDFGLPSQIALNFSAPTGPDVTITLAQFGLDPPLQYNMVANGSGTTVTTLDTTLGLTFADSPLNPLSQQLPVPWNSNKLEFNNGSTGYLGNLTLTSAITGVFSTSAVLTDATGTAFLYRWAQFNLTGAPAPHYNVSGAQATAYYAYNDNQAANTTVTGLNAISTANPALWGYLQYWDTIHGVPKYGISNITGQSSLLLASSEINASTLPTGGFLGGYHVAFASPYVSNVTWISYAVNPYPTGAALGTYHYGQPDKVNVAVPVAVPFIKFTSFSVPTNPLDLNDQYASNGTVFFNGPGSAVIQLYATPVGTGNEVLIGTDPDATNGSFSFDWFVPLGLSAGTSYTITATGTYKTASASVDLGVFSVPAATSATGFLFQKFLGLPLWVWIAIAVAAIVAILVVLLLFRRQAAGKLVECGECGELIPEDATVCPKCGAEFETDLVRCSRCSSTIPANSQFCPECSAQLLGTPGEGASDPERQAYADFTEKFRAEGKKELGDNYTESAFWDWWKRQASYVPFSQWKVQQNKGAPRSGMSAPPAGSETTEPASPPSKAGAQPTSGPGSPAPGAGAGFTSPPLAAAPPVAAGGSALKPCPNCAKEIPPEYLVCPFCGAVTQ